MGISINTNIDAKTAGPWPIVWTKYTVADETQLYSLLMAGKSKVGSQSMPTLALPV